jgi:hypothetical protein
MISADQRKRYWVELHAAFEIARLRPGTLPTLDAFRSDFHAKHNLPPSTKDFTRAHFDTFLAACRAITQPHDLAPQLRALDSPKMRALHFILQHQAAQLKALGIPNPAAYIAKISQDKFRGLNPADLSESHRSVFGSQYSQLDMLKFTIARTISELRQQKGWTVHELLYASNLGQTCTCSACCAGRVRARPARASARTAPEAEHAASELTNAPF